MSKLETFFGSLEILSGNPLVQRMTFNQRGKPHKHPFPEYCYVLNGAGRIVGANREEVVTNDFVSIPSGTEHYMIPNEKPFEILIFYGSKQ